MADRIPARLTLQEGRRFGLQVGAAFLALAGLLWWRHKPVAAATAAVLGGMLSLAGLAFPGRLAPVHRAWMTLALVLSRFTTPVFMGIVYFGVLTPIGALMRLIGRNPLVHRADAGSLWQARPGNRQSDLRRQF